MEVKPVKHVEKPKYPLKTEFNEEELKKQIPKRWMKSPAVKVALGTLAVVTLTGCIAQGGLAEATLKTEASATAIDSMLEGEVLAPCVMVAPLFIHGEGRGEFGGVASMTAFLSEDEALAVINEAAKEYGFEFTSKDAPVFDNVLQPSSDPNPETFKNPEITKMPDKIITLQTDFTDKEHGIAIEFVSGDDVSEWWQWPAASTVQIYDTKDAADQLSDSLEAATQREPGFYTVGVFYDPCEPFRSKAEAKDSSKEQLKKQAKDFFEWLKSQGVI